MGYATDRVLRVGLWAIRPYLVRAWVQTLPTHDVMRGAASTLTRLCPPDWGCDRDDLQPWQHFPLRHRLCLVMCSMEAAC